MGKLGGAMRIDSAARVDVGVDEGGERDGRLESGIETEAQLGHDRVVGAEAGQPDDLVEPLDAPAVLADQGERRREGGRVVARVAGTGGRAGTTLEGFGAEARDHLDVPGRDCLAGAHPQGTARRQLVGLAATEDGADGAPAQHPHGGRAGRPLGEGRERHEGREGGVARTDHGSATAAEAGDHGGVVDVGDEVGDVLALRALTRGGVAVAAQGVRGREGAGRVDDRPRLQTALAAVGRADVHSEGLLGAARVDDTVAAPARDAGDGAPEADAVAQGVGERLEVELGPLGAGRVAVGVGGGPAGRLEEAGPRRVDELGPAGEEPDVPPGAHRRRSVRAALDDEGVLPAFEQVGSCGEPDRSGTDDEGGQRWSSDVNVSHDGSRSD